MPTVMKKKVWPSGKKAGHHAVALPAMAVGSPPSAGTFTRPSLLRQHDDVGRAPSSSLPGPRHAVAHPADRLSCAANSFDLPDTPSAKNAIHWPSGDDNGLDAPLVPLRTRATVESRFRTDRRGPFARRDYHRQRAPIGRDGGRDAKDYWNQPPSGARTSSGLDARLAAGVEAPRTRDPLLPT